MKVSIITPAFLLLTLCIFGQSGKEDAITSTIANLEELLLSRSPHVKQFILNVAANEATVLLSQSTFDVLLTSDISIRRDRQNLLEMDPLNDFFSNVRTSSGTFNIGLQKVFRSSTAISTNVSWSRSADSNTFGLFGEKEDPFTAQNTARFAIGLQQPLLRGRGRSVITANEVAGRLRVEASRADLIQAAAGEVLNMHLVYWQYLSAHKIYEVYQQNEARVRRMLEITQTLIKADKKPAAELIQVYADLADQESQTIFARQLFLEARQNLGRVLGIEMKEAQNLGSPIQDFPIDEADRLLVEDSQDLFFQQAASNRMDMRSLSNNLDALSTLAAFAENDLLPQFDAKLSFNYGGWRMGDDLTNLLSAFGTLPGREVSGQIGLVYQFPLQNRAAKAAYAQQKILIQEQQINFENLQRNIDINLQVALNNLDQSRQALEKSRSSFDYYQQAFENESKKFQSGLTTLLNLIIFQDRLTSIHIRYIQAQQQLAEYLSTLQFEMGTIISENGLQYLNSQVAKQ